MQFLKSQRKMKQMNLSTNVSGVIPTLLLLLSPFSRVRLCVKKYLNLCCLEVNHFQYKTQIGYKEMMEKTFHINTIIKLEWLY